MANYIGITIGPIFDMMSLVSTPAALWATSYMFSMIAKKTCEKLKLHDEEVKIIAPFYDSSDNEFFNKNDGIGLFHDRIIVEATESITLDEINIIKNEVLEEVSKSFNLGKDELKNRVLFIATEIETENGENPILKGGKILDSLELSRKVVFTETDNTILSTFTGALISDKGDMRLSKNSRIKDIAKEILDPEKWSLLKKDGDIKDLSDIAGPVDKTGMKKHNYYAMVRSDGDNMSKIIERLPINKAADDENKLTLTDFSKVCLEYCSAVAQCVKDFNGVPVYSSGDDLLAIMPCDAGEKGTVLNFVKEVNLKFAEMFKPFIDMIEAENEGKDDAEKIALPSLSFGISICFKKFPLYEALDDSAKLLFGIAKSEKNCIAVRLQKHSGQSEGLVIKNSSLDDFLELQESVLSKQNDKDKINSVNDILLSALYKTEQFSEIFNKAKDKTQIKNLFMNIFDRPEHKNNSFVHESLPEFYSGVRENKGFTALGEEGKETEKNDIVVFNFAMRILKFFVEKAGKEGKDNE